MKRRGDGQRNDGAEQLSDEERQCRTHCGAYDCGEQRDCEYLGAIDAEDAAAGCAERFQGRDALAIARQMTGDRIGDADATDQERRSPTSVKNCEKRSTLRSS